MIKTRGIIRALLTLRLGAITIYMKKKPLESLNLAWMTKCGIVTLTITMDIGGKILNTMGMTYIFLRWDGMLTVGTMVHKCPKRKICIGMSCRWRSRRRQPNYVILEICGTVCLYQSGRHESLPEWEVCAEPI